MTKLLSRVIIAFIVSYLLYLNIPWLTTTITSLFILGSVLITISLFFSIYIRNVRFDLFKETALNFTANYNGVTLPLFSTLISAAIYLLIATLTANTYILIAVIYNAFMAAILLDFIQKATNDN